MRLVIRLAVVGIVMGVGWVSYQLSDITSCSGPKADAWAEATIDRMDAASSDYDSWSFSTTTNQFRQFAMRADERYKDQLAQETPNCLDDLQDLTEEFLYYEWKSYDAAAGGSFELAAQYDSDSIYALEAMEREFDKLANENDWQID